MNETGYEISMLYDMTVSELPIASMNTLLTRLPNTEPRRKRTKRPLHLPLLQSP